MDLTAAAAFTAAALSLVNVAATYHLARRGHRENWRREQERPIVARCLTLSADTRGEWWDASLAKQAATAGTWPGSAKEQHWEKGWKLFTDLRYDVAQLDLLASRAVREAARKLVAAHQEEALRLVLTGVGGDDEPPRLESRDKIDKLEAVLVERTRTDLGLGPSLQVPPRSLLGQFLDRDQE